MEISEIKQQLTITQVLNHYGLAADKNGMLRCPFHDDKTPSMRVYESTNTVYCFSSNCKTHGNKLDVIDFVELKEGITKGEAIKRCKEILGVLPQKSTNQIANEPDLLKTFYRFTTHLSKNKAASEYLKTRHLDKSKLEIGFNPSNSKYPHLKNCIIFPLKNKAGEIVSFYGRRVASDNKEGKHFYLKNRTGLYPNYPSREARHLIITEAIIDCATLISHSNHTPQTAYLSLYGTNGFTAEHTQAIKELKQLKEIIFFFDGDHAGRGANKKYAALFKESMGKQLEISFVETPEGEDVNSLLDSHEPEILNHLLENRKQVKSEVESLGTQIETQDPLPITQSQEAYELNTENPELLKYTTQELKIQILGGIKLNGLDRLRVTLKITSTEKPFLFPIRHSLDLYHHKHTQELAENISNQLETTLEKAKQNLNYLTGHLEEYRESRLESLKTPKKKKRALTPYQRQEALDYLQDPNLLARTQADITLSGMIGEKTNSLIALLAYSSRKRAKPLHIMCLGSSGSGKTHLQEKVSACIPEEEKIEITTLSENAFYYFGKQELKGKLILIEDLDGAQDVLYPLRELQSKQKISKTVTLKDTKGNLKTQTLEVEGPVSVSGCTTREKLYEDNANRCLLLYIDQGGMQDQKIMDYQKRSSSGLINQEAEQEAKYRLQNAQMMLQPIKVVNPYAQYIDLPECVFKPRRSMYLLLSFIETVTFYHQYQRPQRVAGDNNSYYIVSTVADVEISFTLLKETLFRKSDELNGACRNFLERLKKYLSQRNEISFKTNEIRKELRMNPNNLKRYIRELLQYNYLKVLGGNRYKGYEYQLEDILEYDTLKNTIDEKINDILLKIKEIEAKE